MNQSKSNTPKKLRSSIALVSGVAVFVVFASLFPDCSVFVNAAMGTLAGGLAIFVG